MSEQVNPDDFIISRKRKLYRFALFSNSPLCFEAEEWAQTSDANTLEVGAGTGLFSVVLAEQMPEQQFVAFDVKADRLQTGAKKAQENSLTNIRFLRGRGDLLADFFVSSSLENIWITFPDPFPKEHSSKHRLTHPRFLNTYKSLLKKEGELYFKTDARDLFEWSLEQFVNQGWTITELSFDLHDSNLSDIYKTKTTYETRFMNEGLPIYFVSCTPPKK